MGQFIVPGRVCGKKPARHDCRTLLFGDYTRDLGEPPTLTNNAAAVIQSGAAWGIMGNDHVGDCPFAGAGHAEMTWTANAGGIFIPTTQVIEAGYAAQSGWNGVVGDPSDQGACLLDVLNYWRMNGIATRKIGAYVSVRPLNTRHIMQAIWRYQGLYIGLQLPDAWLQAPQGQPWDVGAGVSPNADNGHCVWIVDYDADGLTCVTWGYEQRITWPGFQMACDEAYAIYSPDEASADPNLQADLAAVQR